MSRLIPRLLSVIAAMLWNAVSLAQSAPTHTDGEQGRSLAAFIKRFDPAVGTRYVAALVDLNGDGTPEALVYLQASERCGTGGCETLVLVQRGASWRLKTRISITRPPIRVLRRKSNSWHSISVLVSGGGIQPGYEAELAFDGKTYPMNPSVPPARPIAGRAPGTTLIAATPSCGSARCGGTLIRDSVGMLRFCVPGGMQVEEVSSENGDIEYRLTSHGSKRPVLVIRSGPRYSGEIPNWARGCAVRPWITRGGAGQDARCEHSAGIRSRYMTLVPAGYAIYYEVPAAAAAAFDRVLDSTCWNVN